MHGLQSRLTIAGNKNGVPQNGKLKTTGLMFLANLHPLVFSVYSNLTNFNYVLNNRLFVCIVDLELFQTSVVSPSIVTSKCTD